MSGRIPFKAGDYITVYTRDQGRCGICGEPVDPADVEIDHVHPISRGGSHEPKNWQLSHRRCNRLKSARVATDPRPIPYVPVVEEAEGLNVTQAARRLGVHQNTLRQWADKGRVKHIRLMSGVRRFDPDEIERIRVEMGLEPRAEAGR